jgi:hypothetical protein
MFLLPLLLAGIAVEPTPQARPRRLREEGDPSPGLDEALLTMDVPAVAGKSEHTLSDVRDALAQPAPSGLAELLQRRTIRSSDTFEYLMREAWAKHERERLARMDAAARAEEERVALAKSRAQDKRDRKAASRLATRQLSQAGGDPTPAPEADGDNR